MNPIASADSLFLTAREIVGPLDRAQYLAAACGNDHALRKQVDALLREAEEADEFFGVARTAATWSTKVCSEGIGTRIGRYQLLEKIGEGGMGLVYKAQQLEPIVRMVALKIIKTGMDTRQVVARFEAERQALALMDHPNIARVLDGGATERGQPYFVMELVPGVPMTAYCDGHQLTTRERLNLFVPVCEAIQSAHQKGIIHRDIKPSNVLVAVHQGQPMPKVIDFGVAKAINQKLTEKTVFTSMAAMIGTPAYMSPEQVERSRLDVDTRSDIYSLGVLLYELLTETTPLPEERLRRVGFGELQKLLLEEEPERPSIRLSKTLAVLNTARRSISTARWVRQSPIDPDLDWIVMKCLEKDRARRYDTASGLAKDIRRFLSNEPVTARPPSGLYRVKKAVKRNALAFTAAAAVVFVLCVGIGLSLWQAVRAKRAEQEQATERLRAERRLKAGLEFMDRVFTEVGPELQRLIGGSKASSTLSKAGFALMEELRRDEVSNPEFQRVLGMLHLHLAFAQGWPVGNTEGRYEAGLHSATEAIRLLLLSNPHPSSDERVYLLTRAEMVAGYAAMRLLQPERSIAHFHEMEYWATQLAQSNQPEAATHGADYKRWARGCMGWALLSAGSAREALDSAFLPLLHVLGEQPLSEVAVQADDFDERRAAFQGAARSYHQLGNQEQALFYFRKAYIYSDGKARQMPNNVSAAIKQAETCAELGEALMAGRQSEEALWRLTNALQLAESLYVRDSANGGFAQLRITVHRSHAVALASWAEEPCATPDERAWRLCVAQMHLDHAEGLLSELKSESLRHFLSGDLERARMKLQH